MDYIRAFGRISMVTLRYGREYRMDLESLPNGRTKRKMVYIGPLFNYVDSMERHGKQRIILLVLSLLTAFQYIFGFSFYSNLSRVWYSSIPYAFNGIFLIFEFESILYFWGNHVDFNRERKQRGGERIKGLSIAISVFAFISLIGSVSASLAGSVSVQSSDYLYIAVTLILVVTQIAMFLYSRGIRYTEKENPLTNEWENIK